MVRACIVLAHASLEDYLRTLAMLRLPDLDGKFWSQLPLAGTGGRETRFSLAQLSAHRAKGVDEVLRESLGEYLSTRSFSKASQIPAWLNDLGIRSDNVGYLLAELDALMKRRHRIVHAGDMSSGTDAGPLPTLASVREDSPALSTWLYTITALLGEVQAAVFGEAAGERQRRRETWEARRAEVRSGAAAIARGEYDPDPLTRPDCQ
jgi:hypothetical protein